MAFEVRGGSVALEIPLPAALIAALTSVAESVLSFSQSTGFSPLTTLVRFPPTAWTPREPEQCDSPRFTTLVPLSRLVCIH